jgi:alanine racemase
MTQFATADDPHQSMFAEHLRRFEAWPRPLTAFHPSLVVVHAASSPAARRDPASHFDMVRVGDVIYGLDPFSEDPALRNLEPALELFTYVAAVRAVATGERVGYSRPVRSEHGDAYRQFPDRVRRRRGRALTDNADVLIAGVRLPLVGTVARNCVTVDVGSPPAAAVGDRAVLIGRQGDERITAEEVARRSGMVNAEVTCGLSSQVPRVYHRDGKAA